MTYAEFWPRYLRAHTHPLTRALNFLGTTLALLSLICAAIFRDWRFLPAALVIGYGLAWTAHVTIERNRPETFGHPLWSIYSDLRMLALFVSGRLASHLARAARTS